MVVVLVVGEARGAVAQRAPVGVRRQPFEDEGAGDRAGPRSRRRGATSGRHVSLAAVASSPPSSGAARPGELGEQDVVGLVERHALDRVADRRGRRCRAPGSAPPTMKTMSPGQPQPLDQRVGVVGEELQLARLEVAVVDGLVELQDPERQQRREAHPRQPDVRRPERDPRPPLRPALGRDQVAQAEQRQPEGEHPVDAHHRRVAVVGGQRGADLVVGDDRQVDEEAEDAGAEEVPEADGDQEHDRPAVRERRLRARLLGGAELQERPRLDGQEGQREHLGGREERAERHVLGRLAGEVQVVHRPDDAAHRVQDDVEEHDGERDPLAHHAEQHEHVGDHHGGEELEEVLHPQVHDPEAPELGGREVVAGARDQPDGVEGGDRARRQEEQPRHVARVLGGQAPAQDAPEHEDPDEQPDRRAGPATAARGRGTRSPAGRTSWRRRSRARRARRGRSRSASRTRRRRARRAARRPACPGGAARAWRSSARGRCPAATNEVATQNSASWTCQVRIRL